MRSHRYLPLLAFALLVAACGDGERATPSLDAGVEDAFGIAPPTLEHFSGDLPALRERGVLRALVVPSRTGFFVADGAIRGIQAEYLDALEAFLNRGVRAEADRIRVQYVPVALREAIPALLAGRGDLIAAFLAATPQRRTQVAFISGMEIAANEVIVRHRDAPAVGSIADLAAREIVVLDRSSYQEHLWLLNDRLRQLTREPARVIAADRHLRGEDILELVNAGVVDYTVMDDFRARLWSRVMPDLVVESSVVVREDTQPGWAVRRDAPELAAALEDFASGVRAGSLVGNVLLERYFESTEWIEDATVGVERDKLARHIDLFREYGERYDFDALALAAQAYHESGLEHDAKSRRGAIGIMQVRPATARDPNVAIDDIDELENNVHAAVKYQAFLRDRYFADAAISDWDRRALVWAAYNAGPAKVRRARAEAERMGLDPNVWFGNVEIAMARTVSREPVRYVSSIYIYYTAYKLLRERAAARAAARGDAAPPI